jgi:hypothetical protein
MNFPLNKNITIVAVFETISTATSFDSPLPWGWYARGIPNRQVNIFHKYSISTC